MDRPLLNLLALCLITLSIILFCIIAGGYSSFSRSQGRIKEARSYLTEAAEKRLALVAKLGELTHTSSVQESGTSIKEAIQKAEKVLQQVISHDPPVDSSLIKEFENTQNMISQQMVAQMHQLETPSGSTAPEQITELKKQLYAVQDALFVARKQYNNETRYFNTRVQIFPGFLIAKLFNLNNIRYTGISEDTFLSGEKTFTSPAS